MLLSVHWGMLSQAVDSARRGIFGGGGDVSHGGDGISWLR
jgi:hypothetical protein